MPTLKEIKSRIGSVQNTLKITSAMKLVSSAKLRKAQAAIESMRPYQQKLQEILALASVGGSNSVSSALLRSPVRVNAPETESLPPEAKTVIVAMASNSSLCGGFNANVIAKAKAVLKEHPDATVYSIGRKMADAMRKAGYPSPQDFTSLSEKPSYAPVSDLVDKFIEDDVDVILVYNHFVSTGKQVPVEDPLISSVILSESEESDYILEPSREEILATLLPQVMRLRVHTVLLDSIAAEHAARTIAMQAASDNAEDLLGELTLEYNKGRQQKITAEILDLVGGAQQ